MVIRSILRSSSAPATLPSLRRPLPVGAPAHVHAPIRRIDWHPETLWIAAIALVAALAHGINMLNYPLYLMDEGTYTADAWAVLREARLEPYTYTYGHAPAGWFLIAAWTVLTGGFHTFGPAIDSGRVLMLILQVGSTCMLYHIARSISHGISVASATCLIFALSP